MFEELGSTQGRFGLLVATAGTLLFAFNRKLADAVTGWEGFSGWYAIAWVVGLLFVGLFRAHNRAINEAKERERELQRTVTELAGQLEELRSKPAPVLSFGEPYVDEHIPLPAQKTHAIFAFGRLANNQGTRGGEAARKVVVWIECYDLDGSVLVGRLQGRWREAKSVLDGSPFQLQTEEAAIDLEPNGVEHEFDVAMKLPLADTFAIVDAQQQTHEVHAKEARVAVTVSGANVTDGPSAVFRLRTEGRAHGIDITKES
jgi:hypothetical protein